MGRGSGWEREGNPHNPSPGSASGTTKQVELNVNIGINVYFSLFSGVPRLKLQSVLNMIYSSFTSFIYQLQHSNKIEIFSMLPVEIRTASNSVVTVVLGIFLIAVIFQWIRPKQVTHGTKCRRFRKSINLKTTKDSYYEIAGN